MSVGVMGFGVGGEAEDGEEVGGVLAKEVGGYHGAEVAGCTRFCFERGLTERFGSVDEAFLPLHVLAMRVEPVAYRCSRDSGCSDGFITGLDLGFVVAG